jgi:plasmid stabilization system protein ParE
VKLPVVTTPEADAQIHTIDVWWRGNRTASPDSFLDELSNALDLIAQTPHLGRPYRRSPVPGVRRLVLRVTRYHVYYAIGEHEVIVLAVWHGQRAVGPPLRAK